MVAAVKRKVLVVDDNNDSAQTLAVFIRSLGHEVECAGTGQEAITLARSFRPDLAFVDLVLPDIDGLDLAADLKKVVGARLQCFSITAYGDEHARARSKGAGCAGHFVKPVAPAQIEILLEG
jgi:CheY-like chemotaxis protein